jgi:chitin synthase
MHHLIQLSSSPKKSRLLQDQITGVQTIIDAFGGALFGRYIELQFNQRGRMVGLKLLNYLLDTSNVISNFRVFYYLLNGVSNEERSVLQLEATEGNQDGEFDQLKQALQVLGINKKHQARIWQLLACILHLAQLEFMDGTDKETPTIKNPDILSLCADFMGTDPRALEDVLTYKSQIMSSSMVATVILDAKGAACQRDDMIKSLYSLLFTYLVEHINSKLSLDMHNFIGILDLPSHHQQQASFDDFCVNLANERFHTFCQQKIFDIEEYRMENVAINEVPYFSNQACIDLLLGPKQGLVALINQFTPEGKDADVLEAFKKHHGAHASFHSKNNQFSIQHFNNQVAYTSTGFIEANQNTLNPDLVHLIRGGATPPSYNSFMLELFKNVPTQSHPKQTTVIMNAQQTNMPLRRPSKRSKQKSKDVDNHHVLARLTHALDDLFSTLDETLPWFVFCIKPYDQFDSVKVRAQVRAYGLPQIAQQACYSVSYPHEEFIQRYAFPAGEDVVEQCKRIVLELGWDEKQVAIGETKVRHRPLFFLKKNKYSFPFSRFT